MSTRSTIYKKIYEDGTEIHIFEEVLGVNGFPEGFYARIFVPHKFDVVIPFSEELVKEIKTEH